MKTQTSTVLFCLHGLELNFYSYILWKNSMLRRFVVVVLSDKKNATTKNRETRNRHADGTYSIIKTSRQLTCIVLNTITNIIIIYIVCKMGSSARDYIYRCCIYTHAQSHPLAISICRKFFSMCRKSYDISHWIRLTRIFSIFNWNGFNFFSLFFSCTWSTI